MNELQPTTQVIATNEGVMTIGETITAKGDIFIDLSVLRASGGLPKQVRDYIDEQITGANDTDGLELDAIDPNVVALAAYFHAVATSAQQSESQITPANQATKADTTADPSDFDPCDFQSD